MSEWGWKLTLDSNWQNPNDWEAEEVIKLEFYTVEIFFKNEWSQNKYSYP